MDTVETSTPEQTSPVTTPDAPAAPPSDSLAAHAAAYDPKQRRREAEESSDEPRADRAPDGRFRQRSEKQRATAEDVPRIRELTGKWRSEETARKALEAKYAALEQEVKALKEKPLPAEPKPFEAEAPTFEQFADKPDPLLELTRATAAHEVQRQAAEREKAAYEAEREAHAREQMSALRGAYKARMEAFKAAKPDYDAVVNAGPSSAMPDLLAHALLTDERGPEFVYTLSSKPEIFSELLFLSDGRAVTEESVANMRRVLASRMPVATTGSTAPALPSYTPPKPPNPVRTGPTRSGDEPPGDESSLADHERAYGQKRRK